MPQHERVKWAQLRVGIMAIVALGVFAIAVFFISGQGGGLFTKRYTLKAYLPSAGDLRAGAQVRLAGITVGSIARMRISEQSDPARAVELDLKIARNFQDDIRADSVASLETVGLLGDTYINVSRGSPNEPVLPDRGVLKTAESVDVGKVMQNTNNVIMNLNALSEKLNDITSQIQAGKGTMGKLLYNDSLYNKMDSTATSLQAMVNTVQSGHGSLGKLMTDETLYTRSVSTIDRVNNILDDVQHGNGSLSKFISDPSAYNNLNRLLANGNSFIDNINKGNGSLGKLVKNDEFYNHMNSTLGNLDAITARINQGEGTLGKLSTDPTMYNNLDNSAQALKEFLTEFRKNPKKYLTVKMRLF